MSKVYIDTPHNFSEFSEYIISDKETYLEKFLEDNPIYFYDTCAIQCHSNSQNRDKIICYIKSKKGIVVITRTILMELSGDDGLVTSNIIDYLRAINNNNIDIILLDESDLLYILKECTRLTYSECNKELGYAMVTLSESKGAIYDLKRENPNRIVNNLFSESNSSSLYIEFFEYLKNTKTSGDNLGEDLIFLCFIILIRTMVISNLIFLSNDLKSRDSIIKVIEYIRDRYDKNEVSQLTTATLLYKLVKENFVTDKDTLFELLSTSFTGNVRILYVDDKSIQLEQTSLPINCLIDEIFENTSFKIIY